MRLGLSTWQTKIKYLGFAENNAWQYFERTTNNLCYVGFFFVSSQYVHFTVWGMNLIFPRENIFLWLPLILYPTKIIANIWIFLFIANVINIFIFRIILQVFIVTHLTGSTGVFGKSCIRNCNVYHSSNLILDCISSILIISKRVRPHALIAEN